MDFAISGGDERFVHLGLRAEGGSDRIMGLFFRFLRQNGGHLSQRAREGEFAALTEPGAESMEYHYAGIFGLPPEIRPAGGLNH